jgi:pentatricopeptide repeat protein
MMSALGLSVDTVTLASVIALREAKGGGAPVAGAGSEGGAAAAALGFGRVSDLTDAVDAADASSMSTASTAGAFAVRSSVADAEAQVDANLATVLRLFNERVAEAGRTSSSHRKAADRAFYHRRNAAVACNDVMRSYFKLGRPLKALGLLQRMAHERLPLQEDTLRTLATGLAFSGGSDAHGLPPSRVPAAWGGTMPAAAYEAEAARVRQARVDSAWVAKLGRAPSEAVGLEMAQRLRVSGVLEPLRRVRQALCRPFPSAAAASSDASPAPLPPALLLHAALFEPHLSTLEARAQRCGAVTGFLGAPEVAQVSMRWRPGSGDAYAPEARYGIAEDRLGLLSMLPQQHPSARWLAEARSSPTHGWPRGIPLSHWLNGDGSGLLRDAYKLLTNSVQPRQRAAPRALRSLDGSGEDGDQDAAYHAAWQGEAEGDALAGADSDSLGAASDAHVAPAGHLQLSVPNEASLDLLGRLPFLLGFMVGRGLERRDLFRHVDGVLSWASTTLPPARTLQLFLTLYNAGVWGDSLQVRCEGAPLTPGVLLVDVRGVHLTTACLFVQCLLSHWTAMHTLGRSPPVCSQDVAFLTGKAPGRLAQNLLEMMQVDVASPHLGEATLSQHALLVKAEHWRRWLDAGGCDPSVATARAPKAGSARAQPGVVPQLFGHGTQRKLRSATGGETLFGSAGQAARVTARRSGERKP